LSSSPTTAARTPIPGNLLLSPGTCCCCFVHPCLPFKRAIFIKTSTNHRRWHSLATRTYVCRVSISNLDVTWHSQRYTLNRVRSLIYSVDTIATLVIYFVPKIPAVPDRVPPAEARAPPPEDEALACNPRTPHNNQPEQHNKERGDCASYPGMRRGDRRMGRRSQQKRNIILHTGRLL
jgi:hypothetical protein